MIGVTINTRTRYHIKLKNKSIVCGYENMMGYTSNYAYKAINLVRGYTIRKMNMRPLMEEFEEFHNHILRFFIRFYRFVIQKPMLEFKK
jgi:hypothetical protein